VPGGGNTSALCLIPDAIFIVAKVAEVALKIIDAGLKVAFQAVTFCDGDIDSTEIEGAFDRAADIYDQNVDIDSDLAAHDLNIDTDLAAHDLNIDTDLMTHDADIKALLATALGKLDQVIELLLTPQGRRDGFPLP